jgi:hypothetical protein
MHDESAASDESGPRRSGASTHAANAEPLKTIPIGLEHRTGDFRCAKSARVAEFFTREMPTYVRRGYCRIFVFPDPADPTRIWGYYTLSTSELHRDNLPRSQRDRTIGGLPVPLMRIGFMGRDDTAPPGLGVELIVDAARRVHQSETTTAWGLILDAEGGPANAKLFSWYRDTVGFTAIRNADGADTGAMWCPLRRLLPELQTRG